MAKCEGWREGESLVIRGYYEPVEVVRPGVVDNPGFLSSHISWQNQINRIDVPRT